MVIDDRLFARAEQSNAIAGEIVHRQVAEPQPGRIAGG
jgi:hypothetical protein